MMRRFWLRIGSVNGLDLKENKKKKNNTEALHAGKRDDIFCPLLLITCSTCSVLCKNLGSGLGFPHTPATFDHGPPISEMSVRISQ